MNKLSIIFFLISIFFISCETVIDVNIPLEPTKLVINSTLIPGEPFRVNLSGSQHILDNGDYKSVSGAEIKIYENGQLLTTLPDSTDGKYISGSFMPKAGKKYSIEARKNGFEAVTAEETLPEKSAKIISVKIDTVETNDFGYIEKRLEFDIEIDDEGNTENYYEIIVQRKTTGVRYDFSQEPPVITDTTISVRNLYLQSEDPGLEEFQNYGQSIYFDDGLFNGKKYHMKISTNSERYYDSKDVLDDYYEIYLRNTSEAYYLYRRSTELQNWTEDDPFAQPVQVYNNINNGYGIFAGYNNETVYKIKLD